MEAEMRTQLRRQAAAHTDHVRDVLKVQEQELTSAAEQVMMTNMYAFTCFGVKLQHLLETDVKYVTYLFVLLIQSSLLL